MTKTSQLLAVPYRALHLLSFGPRPSLPCLNGGEANCPNVRCQPTARRRILKSRRKYEQQIGGPFERTGRRCRTSGEVCGGGARASAILIERRFLEARSDCHCGALHSP